MVHFLKVLPQYLDRLKDGSKCSEVRFNDRDFQAGDQCNLFKFENGDISIVADFQYKITHIHYGLGMQSGYVVLSFEEIYKHE